MKYTNIIHSEVLQNIPNMGFLVRKYNTIRQPWITLVKILSNKIALSECEGLRMCPPKRSFFGASFERKESIECLPVHQGCQIFYGT
jgi:hypothetical protein